MGVEFPVPRELEGVIVCSVLVCRASGVPEILQLVVFNVKPPGSGGEIEHDVMIPPEGMGVILNMATPCVSV